MNRRTFIKASAMAGLALSSTRLQGATMASANKPVICAFTKNIDFLSDDDLCGLLSDCGFTGLDLTLRKGGRIAPENALTELPRMVAKARSHGLSIPMVVTDISHAESKEVEAIVKAMADNGVTHYRFANHNYDYSQSMEANLGRFKQQMEKLCALNSKNNIHGGIQTHVGNRLGAALWDAWEVVKGLDSSYIGIQYDYRHSLAEGYQSWVNGLRVAASHIGSTCIKDFTWMQNDKGRWTPRSVPLGTGACDYPAYFRLVKELKIDGPMSIHYEYPLLTKDEESLASSAKRQKIHPFILADIQKLKQYLNSHE